MSAREELGVFTEHPWEELWEDGSIDWQPGQHWSVLGETGSGKTTVLVDLCERSMHHAVMVVTKNRDRLVQRLVRERGWVLCRTLDDVQRQLRRSFGDRWEKRQRPKQLIVFHPDLEQVSLSTRAEALSARVEAFLTWVYYDGHSFGGMTVAIDEATGASQQLGLQKPLTLMWDEGRSNDVEVIAGIQRPSFVPKSAWNAPSYLVIFPLHDPDDVLAASKMAGYSNRQDVREAMEHLPEHHHLLCKQRGRRFIVESRVVIRKRKMGRPEDEGGGERER